MRDLVSECKEKVRDKLSKGSNLTEVEVLLKDLESKTKISGVLLVYKTPKGDMLDTLVFYRGSLVDAEMFCVSEGVVTVLSKNSSGG